MSLFADPGKYFHGIYKRSVLSKKHQLFVAFYPSEVRALGFVKYIEEENWDESDLPKYMREDGFSSEPSELRIPWDNVLSLEEVNYQDYRAIRIVCNLRSLVSTRKAIILVPAVECQKAMEQYQVSIRQYMETMRQEEERKQREQEKIEEQEKRNALILVQRELERVLRRRFFQECFEYHTRNAESPFYELLREEYQMQLAALYVDKTGALNFLQIDGLHQKESNSKISYDKIHYYDRGGSIHYVSGIRGKATVSGGSYRGGDFSKAEALWGGWSYGLKGMLRGALLTYEPAEVTMPTSQFSLETQTQKIDDRNVLLNYYSEAYRQYIDIELPEGAYNFLQTYLPRKKRDIVMELEKQEAVRSAEPVRSSGLPDAAGEDAFETRVKKLKMMYDNGMLTQEEYNEEKRALLSSI